MHVPAAVTVQTEGQASKSKLASVSPDAAAVTGQTEGQKLNRYEIKQNKFEHLKKLVLTDNFSLPAAAIMTNVNYGTAKGYAEKDWVFPQVFYE